MSDKASYVTDNWNQNKGQSAEIGRKVVEQMKRDEERSSEDLKKDV